jgi:hypothetical protein
MRNDSSEAPRENIQKLPIEPLEQIRDGTSMYGMNCLRSSEPPTHSRPAVPSAAAANTAIHS